MKDVGVIVGKFQVPYLHEGHIKLLDSVVKAHHLTIVVLGVSLSKCTKKHPLDFTYRAAMINDIYPQVVVVPLLDTPGDDKAWSKNLDTLIGSIVGTMKEVCLYGSRDSFIKYYEGIYETEVIKPSIYVSGTEIREQIGKKSYFNTNFGRGAVWFSQNQWKGPLMCVDIAVAREGWLLLGRKKYEEGYRLPGGKLDSGESLEEAAIRELAEETGALCKEETLNYITSMPVNDPRYMYEYEKITTALFTCEVINPDEVNPGDDFVEVEWFNIDKLKFTDVVKTHVPLIELIIGRKLLLH